MRFDSCILFISPRTLPIKLGITHKLQEFEEHILLEIWTDFEQIKLAITHKLSWLLTNFELGCDM